jgi:hypothetical protein
MEVLICQNKRLSGAIIPVVLVRGGALPVPGQPGLCAPTDLGGLGLRIPMMWFD